MRSYLLCLGAAALFAAAVPVKAYALTGVGETAGEVEDYDSEALERELREMMESGEPDADGETGDMEYDAGTFRPEVSEELLDQLAQMQKVVHPKLESKWSEAESMMIYRLPNQLSFSASVPDGMLTTGPVTFLPMENARVTVRMDGMKVSQAEDGVYREPGDYEINLLAFPAASQSGDSNLYETDFYFRILPEESSQVSLLKAPDGFYIDRLERDGKEIKPENPGWHFLSLDGTYRVRFADERDEDVRFETGFTRDTKAPLLLFDPVPDRQEMTRTVHVESDDPAALVEMYYNGKPMQAALKTLEISGFYQYRVRDRAGNERYYAVKMADRYKMPGPKVIVVTFLGLAGAAAWLIYQRRHPRFL